MKNMLLKSINLIRKFRLLWSKIFKWKKQLMLTKQLYNKKCLKLKEDLRKRISNF